MSIKIEGKSRSRFTIWEGAVLELVSLLIASMYGWLAWFAHSMWGVTFTHTLLMAAIYVTVKADVFSVHRNGTP